MPKNYRVEQQIDIAVDERKHLDKLQAEYNRAIEELVEEIPELKNRKLEIDKYMKIAEARIAEDTRLVKEFSKVSIFRPVDQHIVKELDEIKKTLNTPPKIRKLNWI